MSGPIGLHGGQEFTHGDEPFLDALLMAGAEVARRRQGSVDGAAPHPIRVVFLPTAAARGFPDRAAANGKTAVERRAAECGWAVSVEVARVVDAASAADPQHVARIAAADLMYLPGGDPDLVPGVLAGTPALEAIRTAWEGGAVLAGASAGAMALAEWTWTPSGGVHGLGLVGGVAVVPHYDDVRRTSWQATLDRLAPGGLGYLGLDERTGVMRRRDDEGGGWVVAGRGAAWWFGRDGVEPLVGRDGEVLRLPI